MVVTLEDAKVYLKVDGDAEDALITGFITTAEELCEGVLRFPLLDFDPVPETVKQAVMFATSQFYELREKVEVKILIETIKRMLFAYRMEGW